MHSATFRVATATAGHQRISIAASPSLQQPRQPPQHRRTPPTRTCAAPHTSAKQTGAPPLQHLHRTTIFSPPSFIEAVGPPQFHAPEITTAMSTENETTTPEQPPLQQPRRSSHHVSRHCHLHLHCICRNPNSRERKCTATCQHLIGQSNWSTLVNWSKSAVNSGQNCKYG